MPGYELFGADERAAVNELFDEGGVLFAHGFAAMRKRFHVRELEAELAGTLSAGHALMVSSGTAAIKVALKAVGVRAGDEVITQAFNFISDIEAILDIGAIPVICNVDKTLGIDLKELELAITPKTRAILPVHMLGVPLALADVIEIGRRKNIPVVEDVCESFGSKFGTRYAGTLGDAGVFSFDFGKVITCGEGGAVITNSSTIDKYAREYHDHGHECNPSLPRGRDTRQIQGFNYRMTEIQAVILKAQLKKLGKIVRENEQRFRALEQILSGLVELRVIPENSGPIYDTFIFFEQDPEQRSAIIKILTDHGIGTKNLPDALDWHSAAAWTHILPRQVTDNLKRSAQLLQTAIAIPIFLQKSVEDYRRLGSALAGIIKPMAKV